MVDQNDGLMREVEEELRRERLANLWQQYGTYALAAAALLVISVAGVKVWQSKRIAAAQSAGAQYETATTALTNGKVDEALKAFEGISSSGQDGYAALAALQIAGAHLKQGKAAEAKAAFDKVAADPKADTLLREFATLQSVAINIGDADFTDVQNRLNALLAQSSPWHPNARELVALAAFRAKNYDVARENLRAIVADPSAAEGIIQRANTLLASIAAIEVRMKASKPSDASSDAAGGAAAAGQAKDQKSDPASDTDTKTGAKSAATPDVKKE
ncbi:MAG: tetratricopeptide repeat protein [Alphaproteobacteria bacterium]|nr:tetratricopeptide repeat protein [Alphaproteobacteria bacterium]